mgnify:CR=1 FL=1
MLRYGARKGEKEDPGPIDPTSPVRFTLPIDVDRMEDCDSMSFVSLLSSPSRVFIPVDLVGGNWKNPRSIESLGFVLAIHVDVYATRDG